MVREVADELYIKRVLMVLEDFLFFSLYSFSCIASNSPTLKYILIFVPRYALRVQPSNILITCVRPRPLHAVDPCMCGYCLIIHRQCTGYNQMFPFD